MTTRNAPEWLTEWEYAHRGLHEEGAPENSIAAAQAAIAAGMGIECDIQRSFDDCVMVFHDWELERLTGEPGWVGDRTAEALESHQLLGTDQSPIRVAEFLSLVDGRVPLLIEVKSQPGYDVEWTCVHLEQPLRNYEGDYAVMSFDPRVPQWFALNAPDTIRGLVGTDTLDNGFLGVWRQEGKIEQAQPDFLAIDIRDIPNPVSDRWRESGRPLLSWTIRSAEFREHGLEHADALISEGAGLA